jgi:polysaccharide deacetylase family protein (PEP-CTERM system associated)
MEALQAKRHRVLNALTIDVEDYFQVSALSPYVKRSEWDALPSRVERNVDRILDILAEAGARATFFTLGWIAERCPSMARRIVATGHELASHGYAHERASEQTPERFLADIRLAKTVLEDVTCTEVKGYRAPSFSISEQNTWAFDCIAEAGYRYSSSVYPVRHDHYGMPNAPRFAYQSRAGLLELPVSTFRILGSNLPAGGGGYFRLMPYAISRWIIAQVNERDQQSAIFYFHPWEIDPEQPRFENVSVKARFRHYLNLHRTEARLRRLLADFAWDRVDQTFPQVAG